MNILRATISEDMYEVNSEMSSLEYVLTEESSMLLKCKVLFPTEF